MYIYVYITFLLLAYIKGSCALFTNNGALRTFTTLTTLETILNLHRNSTLIQSDHSWKGQSYLCV